MVLVARVLALLSWAMAAQSPAGEPRFDVADLRPQVNPDFLIAGGPDWVFALLRASRDGLGPGLRPSQADCGSPGAPPPTACAPRLAPGSVTLTGTSLTALVNLLPRFVDHVVVDSTGLTGRFDVQLTWTPGPTEWVAPPSVPGQVPREDGSSLATAVRIDAATWPTDN
jgi:hypothetical protein